MATAPDVVKERSRRDQMWKDIIAAGGPYGLRAAPLRHVGVYGGAQGIWVDKARTEGVGGAENGVAVGVLHTGASYPDDLSDKHLTYHFPNTARTGTRDANEVAALKAAHRLGLPIFAISRPSPSSIYRDVRRGWVEDWNNENQTFLISFGEEPEEHSQPAETDEDPFFLVDQTPLPTTEVPVRPNQVKFKFRVMKRYGEECAFCDMPIYPLLDAIHLRPKSQQGSDDPRNGLVACALHHRALDRGLLGIDPSTLKIVQDPKVADSLKVTKTSLKALSRLPRSIAMVVGTRR